MNCQDLPPLGAPLDGGTFAGITTTKDGKHCAVVLLPTQGRDLTWTKAKAWAKQQGGELPSRPVGALLFANVRASLEPHWHWTCEEFTPSSAWSCNLYRGYQINTRKSYEGSAVAVRLMPLGGGS